MKKTIKMLSWEEKQQTLTLCGEEVLFYHLTCPIADEKKRRGRAVFRYYTRLAEKMAQRAQHELYILSCLALATCREKSREFIPWKINLSVSQTTPFACRPEIVCICTEITEQYGTKEIITFPQIDYWDMRDGLPLSRRAIKKIEKTLPAE